MFSILTEWRDWRPLLLRVLPIVIWQTKSMDFPLAQRC